MIVQRLLSNGFKLPPSTPFMPAFLAAAVNESLKPTLHERNQFEAVKLAIFREQGARSGADLPGYSIHRSKGDGAI